jgi:starch phosphorylase
MNLAWTWDARVRAAMERVGPRLWERCGNNPLALLRDAEDDRLESLGRDADFVAGLERARWSPRAGEAWFGRRGTAPGPSPVAWPDERAGRAFKVAYFCAEFGLAESLPIYAGGLGLLAGDHLKSAAGLGLPLVGVGLLYRRGYFRQRLDESGTQVEMYPDLDLATLPVRRVLAAPGPVSVGVEMPGRVVRAAVWRADVGGVALYLLDTDLPENSPADREITRSLYLGDHEMRIRQELILGIGGVRALEAVGERATVFHMNEGHSAFLALERIRRAREGTGLTFDQVREGLAPAHVFTTHTPVPAGIDRFAPSLVEHYLGPYCPGLGLDVEGLLALGRENVADRSESFSMAVLAIRASRWCNGVSRLHGEVSRAMWRNIWPGVPIDEVPIGHVTNGVHAPGWVGERLGDELDAACGTGWRERPEDMASWEGVSGIDDARLWAVRNECRRELVAWVRERLGARAHPADAGAQQRVGGVLDDSLLTVGFARRFAQYKRGTLLMRDPARLERLLRGRDGRGMQVLIAGKAHPGDAGGKELIRSIVRFARERGLEDRIVVLEDYDIGVARRLVQGCDVWLNTPIRGLEASGTSGMKAAMNGVLHVSTLDGWWDEGYSGDVGYHIESVGVFDHDLPNEHREQFESDALYRLLEHEVLPDFYDRGPDAVPGRWVTRMKRCISTLAPRFSTHRMVQEYAQRYYFPAHDASGKLAADGFRAAAALADHIERYRRAFARVRINSVQHEAARDGATMQVSAVVELNGMRPEEVSVQLRRGLLERNGELGHADLMEMEHQKDLHDGAQRYRAEFVPRRSAREAWVVRVLPRDDGNVTPFIPGIIVTGGINRAEAHAERHG